MEKLCYQLFWLTLYITILAPHKFKMNPNFRSSFVYQAQDILVHYITPLLTIPDYLLFCGKNSFLSFYPFAWLSLLFVYLIVVFVISQYIPVIPSKTSRYPCFFLDVDLIGDENVIKYVGGLALGLISFAYIMVIFDYLMNAEIKLKNNKEKTDQWTKSVEKKKLFLNLHIIQLFMYKK